MDVSVSDFINMSHDPRPPGAPRRVWRDWALLGAGYVSVVVEAVLRPDMPMRPLAVAMAIVMLPLLMWRRTHPLTTAIAGFGGVVIINIVSGVTGTAPVGMFTMALLMIVPYALFRWGSGREATIGLGFVFAAFLSSVITDFTGWGDTIGGLIVMLFPIELGAMVRYQSKSRRQSLAQARSSTREQLARELHDTVAHHVSAIAIQAQGGQALAATDPARAVEVLAVIEEEASRALAEMRNVVGALRDHANLDGSTLDDGFNGSFNGTGDAPNSGGLPADLRPQPGVADVSGLAGITSHFNPAGSDAEGLSAVPVAPQVAVELEGDLSNLKPSVDTTLYRLAQEAVTNAVRHARSASQVLVRIVGDVDEVKLTVHDDGVHNPRPIRSNGFGLVGMAERARLLGGTLDAGPSEQGRGWVVTAVLPKTGGSA